MEPLILTSIIAGALFYGFRELYFNLKPLFHKKATSRCHLDCARCPYAKDHCNH